MSSFSISPVSSSNFKRLDVPADTNKVSHEDKTYVQRRALDAVKSQDFLPRPEAPFLTNLDWVIFHSRQRKLTVAMRSGFMSFFAEAGMHYALLAHLEARSLPPPALIGVSSGGIAAWLLGSKLSKDTVVTIMTSLQRQDFFDAPAPAQFMWRYLCDGYFCHGDRYREHLQSVVNQYGAAARLEDCSPPVTVVVTTMKTPTRNRAVRFGLAVGRLFEALRGHDVWDREPDYACHAVRAGATPDVIRATSALPELFKPVTLPSRLLSDAAHDKAEQACIDGGWGDPLGTTAWPNDPSDAVLVYQVETASFWDRHPWNAFVGVPEAAMPERLHLRVCDLSPLPAIDPIGDLVWRGDLSSGAHILEAAEKKMHGWLSASYTSQCLAEMNAMCNLKIRPSHGTSAP